MYYKSNTTLAYLSGKAGTFVNDATINGTKYSSPGGIKITNQSYSRSVDDAITSYSPTKHGLYTRASGVFGIAYDQSFKPVRHWKRHVSVAHAPPVEYAWSPSAAKESYFKHEGDLSSDLLAWAQPEYELTKYNILPRDCRQGYRPMSVTWDTLKVTSSASVAEMLNDSKLLNLEQMDLGTFLAELRDVRRLADMVKFTKTSSDVSDKFLGLEFGVLPMVSDIKKMYNNIGAMSPAFDNWNDMVKTRQTRAYHTLITDESASGEHIRTTGLFSGSNSYRYKYVYNWKQTYKELAHCYVQPKSVASTVDLALQASLWGLNKPLHVVWNVIPMSFAVDWVVNVGDLIDKFENSEPKLEFDIAAAGVSAKLHTEVTTDVYCVVNGQELFVGSSWVDNTEYFRIPTPIQTVFNHLSAHPIGPLEFGSTLSGMKIALSSALVHQKMFKF